MAFFTYISDFLGERVCFVAVLHVHLELRVCFLVVVELHNVAVIHLFVDAAFALSIHPVVFCQKFLFANDFFHHILSGKTQKRVNIRRNLSELKLSKAEEFQGFQSELWPD